MSDQPEIEEVTPWQLVKALFPLLAFIAAMGLLSFLWAVTHG